MFEYRDLFPHKEIRGCQVKAIEFALDSFINDEKKIVIIEAGTGVGKSAIGLTASRMLCKNAEQYVDFGEGGYFLTTQKI